MAKSVNKKPVQVQDEDDLSARMLRAISGPVAADPPPAAPVAESAPVQDTAANAPDGQAAAVKDQGPSKEPDWHKKGRKEAKTTVVRCIVIDKDDHWHQEAQVDLKGMDASGFMWGYYGQVLPVLVEMVAGTLTPWFLPDAAGESSNRLFKAAHPDGFKATFKHKNTMLQKIAIGLMVALVLGLVFIMYILINN